MNDLARSIRLDPSGDVVAAGEVQNTATGKDFIIVKLSAMTGAPLWQRQINGSADLDDFARSVRVDSAGDILVGGDLRNTGSSDFAVLKLAGLTGAEMWRRVIDGTAQGNDLVRTMRVDTVGDVVAAGELQNIGTGRDFAVVKLSGVTGAEVWRRQIDGSASVDDLARSVRVDAAGDVIAAGELQNTGTGIDFAVVKLSGSTGTEVWRRLINGTASGNDAAHAVRVDSSGDILACGAVQNSGTDLDFTVVKLSPADGSQIWHREINGRASGPDQATALAEDSSGDVVAAGFTQNPATNMDFAVIKLRGSDGSDFMPQGTTTTTTTLPPATCFTIPECELALAAALPAVQGATGKNAKRVARQLNRFDHKLNRILDHALRAPGKKRPRLYRRARAILGHTLAGAQVAGSHGVLGVALGPIQTAISGLLALTAP